MRIKRLFSLIFIIGCANAQAGSWDPLTGARVSMAASQTILSSPPLPTLETNVSSSFTLQGTYLAGRYDDSVGSQYDNGNFYGEVAGFGYTSPSFGPWGFYAMFMASQMTGEINGIDPSLTQTFSLKDMTTSALTAAAGVSVRVIGEGRSPFAAGLFGGPVWSSIKTKFHADVPSLSYVSPDYSSSPTIYGILAGVQLKYRIAHFLIQPYGLYMQELSSSCKPFSTPNSGDIWPACDGDSRKAYMPASFSAFGLNLGYRSFSFNAFSQMKNDSSMSNIQIKQYQLSYTLNFEI